MNYQLSNRIQKVKPSATLAITAKAQELRAEGKDIIGLGAGEPDFDTPDHIKQAGIDAINSGQTRYTAVDGIPSLKNAIIAKFKRDNQLDYEPNQILVSSGGKQSFYNLCQALLNDGDEVIIPAPYWVSYPDMAILGGGVPVILQAGLEQGFKITPAQLDEAINDKTRLFVINSPSNPTGVAYTRAELAALGEVLLKYPQVMIASDDMYEHILWADEPFANILNSCPELYDRTFVLNGVSKAYAMTGWRIGYAAGPEPLIKAMKKVQSQSTSNPNSIAQVASEEAINGDQSCIAEMLVHFKSRHDFVVKRFNEISNVNCLPSQGAFYSFPDMRDVIAKLDNIDDDVQLAEYLIEHANVAVVPGSAFGQPGYMRISFATSMENLEKALDRIEKALN